jgi:hypothetical protein
MHDTQPLLAGSDFPAMFRKPLEILQVNLGCFIPESNSENTTPPSHTNQPPERSTR